MRRSTFSPRSGAQNCEKMFTSDPNIDLGGKSASGHRTKLQRGGKAHCRALRRSLTGLCVASYPAQMQTTGLRLAQKRRKEMISGSSCCSFNQPRTFRTAGYRWGERLDASFFFIACLFRCCYGLGFLESGKISIKKRRLCAAC